MSAVSASPFTEAHNQSIASQYVYAYLGDKREEYSSLLSDDVKAKIYRNGVLELDGGKEKLMAYMDAGVFSCVNHTSNISLRIMTAADRPVIEVVSVQYRDMEEKDEIKKLDGRVTDTVTFTITEGKIFELKHDYFPQILTSK